ncbi:uncharacterized protein [Penaeus vannamei]|uniref:uncharacterized protein n=1 Tax=Penaeus vannamei TaxID=6689 RepID=UPI00387F3B05
MSYSRSYLSTAVPSLRRIGNRYIVHFVRLADAEIRLLTDKVMDPCNQIRNFDFESAQNIADVNSSKKPFKLQLKVDTPVLDLQEAVPNLPRRYWSPSFKGKQLNKSCAHYPFYNQIRYNNGRWQIFSTSNGTFYLFGAYYDNRTTVDGPIVRVLGMMDRVVQQVSIFCQFWLFGQNKPVFAKVSGHTYIWTTFSHITYRLLRPCLLSCQMPSDYAHQVPESVSLVEQPCDTATTNLRVVNNRPPEGQTKDFAVCVKGLDIYHKDKSIFLVEWLETLYLLGADKVFMYDLQVHPNTAKVLKYYQETGFVDLTKLTLPGDQPNIPELSHHYLNTRILDKLLNELIPYNDCLYRNIYNYKYVVLLDIDEIIVPKNHSSWRTLMEVVVEQAFKENPVPRTSFDARNVYFLDSMIEKHGFFNDIPQYMHILQHVYRARNHTKPRHSVKCFHDTQLVLTLHNHYPSSCLGKCRYYSIPTEIAQLQHYRSECIDSLRQLCKNEFRKNTVLDTAIWKYKEPLIERVSATLKTLGFFGSNELSRK